MNNLYFLQINETIDEPIFLQMLELLSPEKREQIKRYRFDLDKKLSLYSEALVRILACQFLNISNKDITFVKSSFGKPYIQEYSNFHFNISHTKSAIAVIISDKSIGVDIEAIREADMLIANRFFTDDEIRYITEANEYKNKRFFEIWTKKEAYIKYIGKGLSIPLNSFNTLDDDLSSIITTFEKDGYIISVCGNYAAVKYNMVDLFEENIINMADGILSPLI